MAARMAAPQVALAPSYAPRRSRRLAAALAAVPARAAAVAFPDEVVAEAAEVELGVLSDVTTWLDAANAGSPPKRLQMQVAHLAQDTTVLRSLDWDRARFDIEFGLSVRCPRATSHCPFSPPSHRTGRRTTAT